MMDRIICDECPSPATIHIEYGTDKDRRKVHLCYEHASALWKRCAPKVNSGEMMWNNYEISMAGPD